MRKSTLKYQELKTQSFKDLQKFNFVNESMEQPQKNLKQVFFICYYKPCRISVKVHVFTIK